MNIKTISLYSSNSHASSEIYTILNKDRELCRFRWSGQTAIDFDIPSIEGLDNLPYFMSRDIYSWLKSRTPQKHRAFMRELLQQLGGTTDRLVLDYSKGLSLTDTLWVKRESENLKWSDVSLYRNEFDQLIAHIAFDGGLYGKAFRTTSPEFATDGVLPKCWIRDNNGNIFLKKAGSTGFSNAGNEPYSEVMASQVLRALDYNHVDYSLERFRGRVVSSCQLMTSESVSLVPLYKLCKSYDFLSIRHCVEALGFQRDFYRMLVFDYLSLNTDRHLGNFGVLVDADTFEPLRLAPIYDNGASMLCYYTGSQSMDEYLVQAIPALYDSFDETIPYWKKMVSNCHNVQRLIDFTFNKEELTEYPEDKLSLVEKFLQSRVTYFLSL